jgi:YVTN family beta-propeller protein
MKKCLRQLPALLSVGTLLLGPAALCATDKPYHPVREIPVGGDGGWDYLSVDPAAHRLYVSHGTEVVVINTADDTVAGRIADTPGVHGIAIAPELKRGFSTNGRDNSMSIVDLGTLKTVAKVATGENPDAMLYEPGRREVYAFNGRGQSATVIDAQTGRPVATIPLGGKPEFCAADSAAGRVYCNIEDTNEVAAIDTATHQVVSRWPIAPGAEATGMAIDVAHHRLFIGCHNRLLAMLDTASGKAVATVPIGAGVDANDFDPGTQLAFASCGDGTVTIAHEDAPDKLTVVQTLTTEPRARTMALDPATHKIYLASAKFEAPAEPPKPGQRPRPKMVPGSFKVLVYGRD